MQYLLNNVTPVFSLCFVQTDQPSDTGMYVCMYMYVHMIVHVERST